MTIAREFENLEILISVLNERALSNINELIRRIEALDAASEGVRRIRINVRVRDRELDALLAKMAAAEAVDELDTGAATSGGRVGEGGAAASQRSTLIALAQTRNQLLTQLLMAQRSVATNMRSGGFGGIGRRGPQRGERGFTEPGFFDREDGGLTNIRMRDFHNALAKLVPMLLVLVGSLPALLTALVGLAAAAISATAALGGLAAIGTMGLAQARGDGDMAAGLEDILSDISQMFQDAFLPVAQRFVPLMERAMDGLGILFENVARSMSRLLTMQDEARAFGQWINRVLPGAIVNMIEMTKAFAGLFSSIGAFIENTDILEAFSHTLADMTPALYAFTNLFIEALPAIVAFSTGMLNVLTALMALINGLMWLGNVIPLGAETLGEFVATALSLITILSIARALIAASIIPTIYGYVTAMFAKIGVDLKATMATTALASVVGVEAATKLATAAATVVLIGALTLGIGAILGLTGGLMSSADAADQASKSLSDFNSELNETGDSSPYRGPDDAPNSTSEGAFSRASGGGSGSVENHFHGDTDPDDFDTKMNNTLFRMR